MRVQSPFETTHNTLSEESDMQDVLRILAKDGGRLTAQDRETLGRAADEIAASRHLIAMLSVKCNELTQELAAVRAKALFPFMSMESGPLTLVARSCQL